MKIMGLIITYFESGREKNGKERKRKSRGKTKKIK